MSCFIVDKENIQVQAEFIKLVLDGHGDRFRLCANEALVDVFSDCKGSFGYDAHKIYRKLYIANLRAWNGRYKENVREFDRYEYKPFNGVLVQLYMYMRCYLYQCAEEPVYNTPIYKAVRELSRDLAGAIVLKLADENGAEWK